MASTPSVLRPYVHPANVVRDLPPGALEGSRVMLINMPLREAAPPNIAPLGPTLLAARLRQYGADPVIVDLNAYRLPVVHGDPSIRDSQFTTHEELDSLGLPLAYRTDTRRWRYLTIVEAEQLIQRTIRRHGEPDLVGFSGLITTLRWQENIARVIRRILPDTILATGNGLATEFREALFEWIPELDAVCHSEGDDAILKMAYDAKLIRREGFRSAEASGKLRPYLVGTSPNGRPRFVYDGGRPEDLDALPLPAWDLLGEDVDGVRVLETYISNPVWGAGARNSSATPFSARRSLNTVSSRGCPFACKFCFRGAQGERRYGVRSARNLAGEIETLARKYGVDFVGITDDNFMVDPRRIRDLVPVMEPIVRDLGVHWGTHGRLDEAADLRPVSSASRLAARGSRVEDMSRAGCVYIGFGAESASPRVLEAMGKGGFILSNGAVRLHGHDFPTAMVEGVRRTRDAGIHGNCTWIMGYPCETLEDLKTSVAFIQWQLDLHTSGLPAGSTEFEAARAGVNQSMFTATAYPGTELFRDPYVQEVLAREFGLRFDPVSGGPVADAALHHYVLELDDATKVLHSREGRPLNFSAMSLETFLEARALADRGELFRILDLEERPASGVGRPAVPRVGGAPRSPDPRVSLSDAS